LARTRFIVSVNLYIFSNIYHCDNFEKDVDLKYFYTFNIYVKLGRLVTKAENIKADTHKILKLTHFWGMEDIKAYTFSCAKDINADSYVLRNNVKNIDRY